MLPDSKSNKRFANAFNIRYEIRLLLPFSAINFIGAIESSFKGMKMKVRKMKKVTQCPSRINLEVSVTKPVTWLKQPNWYPANRIRIWSDVLVICHFHILPFSVGTNQILDSLDSVLIFIVGYHLLLSHPSHDQFRFD